MKRGGDLAILLSWAPLIGDAIPLAAGGLGYSMPRFIVLSAIGRFCRYAILVVGYSAV
jgi:membrane protein YqaA with SNARE-associated domain